MFEALVQVKLMKPSCQLLKITRSLSYSRQTMAKNCFAVIVYLAQVLHLCIMFYFAQLSSLFYVSESLVVFLCLIA